MTHSNLTDVVIHSPNGYFPRSNSIKKVTIHHMAGVMTAEQCGMVFQNTARQASSNYGIGNDGRIGCYLEEENGSWCSSSYSNDNQAITIEVSDCYAGGDWPISDAAWRSMIALCADICTRYGIEPTCDDTISGSTFTFHRWFSATGCPGEYIYSRRHQIVAEVKAAMNGTGGEWVKDKSNGKWWYRWSGGGYPASKWEYINDKWYLFDADGYMHVGWAKWDGDWYYLQPETKDTGTAFGYMVTGWHTLKWSGGTAKFWFDKSSGKMYMDGFKKISGKWYAFNENGALITKDSDITVGSKGAITIS